MWAERPWAERPCGQKTHGQSLPHCFTAASTPRLRYPPPPLHRLAATSLPPPGRLPPPASSGRPPHRRKLGPSFTAVVPPTGAQATGLAAAESVRVVAATWRQGHSGVQRPARMAAKLATRDGGRHGRLAARSVAVQTANRKRRLEPAARSAPTAVAAAVHALAYDVCVRRNLCECPLSALWLATCICACISVESGRCMSTT